MSHFEGNLKNMTSIEESIRKTMTKIQELKHKVLKSNNCWPFKMNQVVVKNEYIELY